MRIFSKLYRLVLRWAEHRHAPYYLAGVSFAESSMFPVPPDVMLVSMALAKPDRSWSYALVATVSSVFGGMLGYVIGALFMQIILPKLQLLGYGPAYEMVQHWFAQWGFWVVFVAGFSPVPYKLFTLGAGAMHLSFIPFVIASIIGRGARFYLVAAAMYVGGEKIQRVLHRYVDLVGWLLVLLCVFAYIVYWFYRH